MKFMIFVIDDSSGSATSEEMAAIDAFNEKLQSNGHWIFAGGLSGPGRSTLIDNRNGAGIESQTSLFPQAENYSGFWLIETASADEALNLAREGSRACNRKVELRPLLG